MVHPANGSGGGADGIDAIHARFTARTQGTPYTATRTGDEILLRMDLDDLAWRSVLFARRISLQYTIRLRFDPAARTYSREQEIRDLRWTAGGPGGAPGVSVSASVQRGTVVRKESHRHTAVGPDGARGAAYRFDSRELTDLVAEVMDPTGWTRTMDPVTRLGLTIAGGVLGALVVAGLVVLAVLLL